jgi:hypothetical protein
MLAESAFVVKFKKLLDQLSILKIDDFYGRFLIRLKISHYNRFWVNPNAVNTQKPSNNTKKRTQTQKKPRPIWTEG